MESRDLPRDRIDFFRNSQWRWAAPDVVRRMRPALPFIQSLNGSLPCVAPHPRFIIDGNSKIVAEFWPGHAFWLVFMKARRPLAGKIHLSKYRRGDERQRENGYQSATGHVSSVLKYSQMIESYAVRVQH